MKLAILTCGILPVPAVQGGAVENLIDFYLEYNNRKRLHDITIYSPRHPKVAKHEALSSNNNHYVLIDTSSYKARIIRRAHKYFHSQEYYNCFIEYYFEQIYKDLKKKVFDYIILENCPGYAYKLSKRGYDNLVLHLHNDLVNSNSRFHDIIGSSFTKVITVSDYIKGRAATIIPTQRIETVHNGIDLNNFNPQKASSISRISIGLSDDDFVIVYSGRINPEKGVSELIDAMLQLKDTPKIKLLIIGGTFFGNTNDEDDFIRSLKDKAKSIRDNIIFTGFISYEKMPDYLKLANIAVIPSIWNDPFPTTELEAQAMGLPIITTKRGGIPEEVSEENAILLETDNQIRENLSAAIYELYQHPDKRKQMAAASLERAKLFDKDTYTKNFFAALEDLKGNC